MKNDISKRQLTDTYSQLVALLDGLEFIQGKLGVDRMQLEYIDDFLSKVEQLVEQQIQNDNEKEKN